MTQIVLERIWRCETCKHLKKEEEVSCITGDWTCVKCQSNVKGVHHEFFEISNAEG